MSYQRKIVCTVAKRVAICLRFAKRRGSHQNEARAKRNCRSHCQITIIFVFDNPITFARVILETRTIQNKDDPALVVNQTSLLQSARRDADAGATDAEHA